MARSRTSYRTDLHYDDEDNDIPPLEDFSELLESKLKLKDKKNVVQREYLEPQKSEEELKIHSVEQLLLNEPAACTKTVRNNDDKGKNKSEGNFCGFKKGFLSSQEVKSSEVKIKAPKGNKTLPVVTSKHPVKDARIFDEVQENMKSSCAALQSADWITDDLLKKIEGNPLLGKYLGDKEFSQVLAGLQKDPEKFYSKLQANPELMKAFSEFCGLMGDHFTAMGSKPSTTTRQQVGRNDADISECSRYSSKQNFEHDNEVREILADPRIQELLTLFKRHPKESRRFLQSADYDLHSKVQTLISKGFLSVATT